MPAQPTGTVTFLFTDIEGSTKLWQQHPAAMSGALTRHHAILRHVIEKNQGYVFQIVGDAFCAAFSTALDGLNTVLAAQRALRDEPWGETGTLRVRMALHTGVAEMRAGDYTSGEYASGLTLSRCARLLSPGHGGQVLLSQTTRDLVEHDLTADICLRDLGERRLKDLERPEHIYQLIAPDLPSEFPPLKTLDALPNNLPIQLTSFIGREREMAQLKQLVQTTRLVTLTGAGGSGKTRLALQTAAALLDDFKDGVWLVELASLTDPALVPQSVASVFGVREQQGYTILDLLTEYLRQKQVFLILDNSEHLIEACAQLADGILRTAPHVHLLVTSREALGIAGEQIFYVPSLEIPDSRETLSVETLAQMESVRLFVERAMAVQPRFALSSANASAVAQICRRLDGIPLAIELAASRVQALSVEQIAKRLDDAFRLLTGGSRTALPRQQTLRALVTWSYNLLSAQERLLLHRLSVFAGGWTLEAAESVCAGDGIEREEVLDLLTRLVAKSLTLKEEQAGEARYRFLETIRLYAREKLFESGEGERLRDRHLDYFMLWAEVAEPKLKGAEQLAWLKQLENERDNLRTALEWSVDSAVESGLRLAGALVWFWWLHTHYSEGWEWLEGLLARSGQLRSAARAKALYGAAHLSVFLTDFARAEVLGEEALLLSETIGDKRCTAWSVFMLGLAMTFQNKNARALALHEESLVLFKDLGGQWEIALALLHVGSRVLNFQEDYDRACNLLEESQSLFRQLADKWGQSLVLGPLGLLARIQGNYAQARAISEERLCLSEELGDKLGIARALGGLGDAAFTLGDYAEAATQYEASLKVRRDFGIKVEFLGPLLRLGFVRLHQNDLATAWSLMVEALNLCQKADTADTAMCLDGLAVVCMAREQPEQAVRLFGAAQASLESIHARPWQIIPSEIERNIADAREQLGQAAFDAAWAEGQKMTLEQAIEYALKENTRD